MQGGSQEKELCNINHVQSTVTAAIRLSEEKLTIYINADSVRKDLVNRCFDDIALSVLEKI
jgi:hypothetical protein